jgi:tetratricopeptide (TPR) repeat protein
VIRPLALSTALLAFAAGASGLAQPNLWAQCEQSEAEGAVAACTALIAAAPDLSAAHYNRGIAQWRKGQRERANAGPVSDAYEQALADYARAIALDPGDARPFVNRGIVHYEQGRFASAIADYDQALRLQPDLPEALNNRALAYIRAGRYDLAQRDFDHVIRLVKNYGNALINRSLPADTGWAEAR